MKPMSSCALSPVMNEMIAVGVANSKKTPNNHEYSKLVSDFGMYSYLASGKSSYRVLCRNLPLPQEATICKIM